MKIPVKAVICDTLVLLSKNSVPLLFLLPILSFFVDEGERQDSEVCIYASRSRNSKIINVVQNRQLLQLQIKRIKHDVDRYEQTASSILALNESRLEAVTAEAGCRLLECSNKEVTYQKMLILRLFEIFNEF